MLDNHIGDIQHQEQAAAASQNAGGNALAEEANQDEDYLLIDFDKLTIPFDDL